MSRRDTTRGRWLFAAALIGLILTLPDKRPPDPPGGEPATRMSRRDVFAVWLYIGVIAVAFIVFFEIDALLGAIQGASLRTYSTSVFTGPSVPWDTTDLSSALQLWLSGEHRMLALSLIRMHVVADLVFIVAYFLLFRLWIRSYFAGRLFTSPEAAKRSIALLAVVDVLETLLTGFLPATPLALLQWVTITKWSLVVAVAIWIIVSWLRSRGRSTADRIVGAHKRGGPQTLGSATAPLLIVAVVFLIVVAFPGDGALGQLPDVLRYQFTEAEWWVRALSIGALGALIAAVATAGVVATGPVEPVEPGEWSPLLAVGGLSLAMFIVAWTSNGSPAWGPLAPAIVLAGIALVAWPRRRSSKGSSTAIDVADHGSEIVGDNKEKARRLAVIAGAIAVGGGLGSVRAAAGPLLLDPGQHTVTEWTLAIAAVLLTVFLTWWLATSIPAQLTLVVVLVVALAALAGSVVWLQGLLWPGVLGVVAALAGGFLTWLLVTANAPIALSLDETKGKRWPIAIVFTVVLLGAGILAVVPSFGEQLGTTGVIDIGLASIAVLAGTLVWLSRKIRPWWVTEAAGLGPRPPWGTFLLVAWLLASPLTDVGYHDTRVDDTSSAHYQYSDLGEYGPGADEDTALARWLDAQNGCELQRDHNQVVYPMVLLAAPGGGIRAAYWTSSVLDRLTPIDNDCADKRLFLISGVSGGSVGIAAWLAAGETGVESAEVISAISADSALAASVVGVFRDIFHPLIGVADVWGDRAELLENGWVTTGTVGSDCVFTTTEPSGRCSTDVEDFLSWEDLTTHDWTPVVMLNGSSVADSCRTVVSNVNGLPASPGIDCRNTDDVEGPLIVTIDPRAALLAPDTELSGNECPGPNAEIPLITSALLSARFPGVSPSGALHGCWLRPSLKAGIDELRPVENLTFVVDGGYYENSGLLSLLGVWDDLESSITAYNAAASQSGEPTVEPWIVIASNHYTSNVEAPPPGRPFELVLPLTTFFAVRDAYGQATFEQLAVDEMSSFAASPCGAASSDGGTCPEMDSTVVSIAPSQRPTIAAPLGWVLSEITRDDLDDNIERLDEDDRFDDLARALDVSND